MHCSNKKTENLKIDRKVRFPFNFVRFLQVFVAKFLYKNNLSLCNFLGNEKLIIRFNQSCQKAAILSLGSLD